MRESVRSFRGPRTYNSGKLVKTASWTTSSGLIRQVGWGGEINQSCGSWDQTERPLGPVTRDVPVHTPAPKAHVALTRGSNCHFPLLYNRDQNRT